MRKVMEKNLRRTAAVALALALAAGLSACGGSKEAAQPGAEESAAAASTVSGPINPEEYKSEEVIKEEPAKEEAEAAAAVKEENKDVIEKPEASEENIQAEEKKTEKKKEEEQSAASNLNDILDGEMSFDGMELQFPLEIKNMKLGNWTLAYEIDGDPSDKVLQVQEVVLAKMTNPAYTDADVIVKAEFGNYTDSKANLTDLPVTGIYITKGKGKDGAEPKLPALELPCGFTWGTPEGEIHTQLGEASFSGTFDYDFDYMYENGEYLLELAGMSDTGLEYVVYSVE